MVRSLGRLVLLALVAAGCGGGTSNLSDLSLADADCVTTPRLCGRCAKDDDCQGNAAGPRCETNTGKCVACLPAPAVDNCPSGQVCTFTNGEFKCSSTCGSLRDCAKIMGAGFDCCSGICVATGTDTANCGACGNKCDTPLNGTSSCFTGHCVIGSCNTGFDDCDKLLDNGCEVAVGTDPTNCGGCGKVCKPFPNGVPLCTDGACGSTCSPGYVHCSQKPEDGCEIDSTGDPMNCGACGKACTAPANATAACDGSKCSFRCKPGFSDCNGDAKDGCEVNNNGDVNNCGHCGNLCPLRPQAQAATCTAGQCGSSCKDGYGDCDGNAANGCESTLATDLANCGACGAGCSNNHATPTCSAGVCSLVCAKDWNDCNMDGKDGCEANFQSDAKNCGGCGMVCPQNLNFCAKGVCTSAPPYPDACSQDKDPNSGSFYVICSMNITGAWITAFLGGGGGCTYGALAICQKYGFTKVNRWGGTCGTICGYCTGNTCQNPQGQFNFGGPYTTFDNGGGNPQGGGNISCTVHWECAP